MLFQCSQIHPDVVCDHGAPPGPKGLASGSPMAAAGPRARVGLDGDLLPLPFGALEALGTHGLGLVSVRGGAAADGRDQAVPGEAKATGLISTVLMVAQSRVRRLETRKLLSEAYQGVTFIDGHKASMERKKVAA